jgi:hypothetical protein
MAKRKRNGRVLLAWKLPGQQISAPIYACI